LDGDGGKQLVNMNSEPQGYFELDDDNEWQLFKRFQNLPNINFSRYECKNVGFEMAMEKRKF